MERVETPRAIIRDGYTIPFSIPEKPGVSAGIKGKRRPLTNLGLTILLDACKPSTYDVPSTLPKGMTKAEWLERQIDSARSKAIAKQIFEWDVVDEDGESVEITPEAVSSIYPPTLLADLMDVVCGVNSAAESKTAEAEQDEKN